MKIVIFIYNLVRIGSGIVGNVFTTFVLLWNHPAGAFFWAKRQFSHILDMVIFQKMSFGRKLDFCAKESMVQPLVFVGGLYTPLTNIRVCFKTGFF